MRTLSFRKSLFTSVLLLVVMLARAQQPRQTIVSPQINGDNTVTFRLKAPAASSVKIKGTWMKDNEAAIAMTQTDSLWSFTTSTLDPDFYRYNFYLEGVEILDPANSYAERAGTRYESIFIVGGQSSLYTIKDVPHGTISTVWYNSPTLAGQTHLNFWASRKRTEFCTKVEMQSFSEHFSSITDPRVERTKRHKLIDILFITMAAVICGCDEWEEIELYAEKKEAWLRKYLELPNGIPSHDTINRVISAIDPSVMQRCFVEWVSGIATLSKGEVVSIDGKRLCGSGQDGKDAIVHMVSAWSSANHLVLGSYKVEDKSNEITAIPKLLEMLDLTDCTVTIDAMG